MDGVRGGLPKESNLNQTDANSTEGASRKSRSANLAIKHKTGGARSNSSSRQFLDGHRDVGVTSSAVSSPRLNQQQTNVDLYATVNKIKSSVVGNAGGKEAGNLQASSGATAEPIFMDMDELLASSRDYGMQVKSEAKGEWYAGDYVADFENPSLVFDNHDMPTQAQLLADGDAYYKPDGEVVFVPSAKHEYKDKLKVKLAPSNTKGEKLPKSILKKHTKYPNALEKVSNFLKSGAKGGAVTSNKVNKVKFNDDKKVMLIPKRRLEE